MNASIEYSEVVKDYFRDYKRAARWDRLLYVAMTILYALNPFRKDFDLLRYAAGLPLLLALLSGVLHMVSLPMMMYLVPYTKQMREKYIQKYLNVKIAVPMVISVVFDIVLLIINPALIGNIVLQILIVFFITSIMGMLQDGPVLANEKKVAFGGIREFTGMFLLICYIASLVMFIICSSTISILEFWTVLLVTLFIFGPITIFLVKRWGQIKSNFADYEMATKTEVQNRR